MTLLRRKSSSVPRAPPLLKTCVACWIALDSVSAAKIHAFRTSVIGRLGQSGSLSTRSSVSGFPLDEHHPARPPASFTSPRVAGESPPTQIGGLGC